MQGSWGLGKGRLLWKHLAKAAQDLLAKACSYSLVVLMPEVPSLLGLRLRVTYSPAAYIVPNKKPESEMCL